MRIDNVQEAIGNTPLVRLNHLVSEEMAEVWVKLEYLNPAGSVKDRVALFMIEAAKKEGLLPPGGTIVEATSGNTGLALAMLATSGGFGCIIIMPDTMSAERRLLAKAYGAEIILTDGKEGMAGAVALAGDLADREGYFLPNQFNNVNNLRAHYETTGPEIIQDADGPIAAFVAGVGTGGTLSGAGRRLKEEYDAISIVAVEPKSSPVLSGGVPGSHGIQGIGANFVPEILDRSIIDSIVAVSDGQALDTAKKLGAKEGLLCGISSGANVFAALKIARKLGPGKKVVTILPDTGERYLSTPLFSGE